MKAVFQEVYGSADVLRVADVAVPEIGDGDVLVRVAAASVNPLDWHIMRGKPFIVRFASGLRAPKQPIRGVDVAGRVEAVGAGVTGVETGDEVFGFASGTFAEFVRVSEGQLLPKPAALTHEQAATVPVAGMTALQGLRDLGKLEAGQHVLVIGASGGVGTFAVQIAKAFGAEVTGVCSTRNVALVTSIGADHVVDYTRQDVAAERSRYDVVFQLAGTASPLRLRRILTPKGTLVLSSGMGRLSGIDRIVKAMATSPFVGQRLVTWVAKENREDLAVLADLLEAGTIVPVVDSAYALQDTPEAIRYVEAGHTRGKVVVTV